MSLALPFAGVDRRTAGLRIVLLAVTLLGMAACAPVWFNDRLYPLTPIAPWFPILPHPADKILFGMMLAALAAAGWCYRRAVGFFLAASLFAFGEDQNRGQPWLYMYWVLLLLTLFPAPAPLAACRWAMSVVYLWSGLQKLNEQFFATAPDWFVAPAIKWGLPVIIIRMLHSLVFATPFIEIALSLALWIPAARKPAVAVVAALHLSILLFLGPLGYNYNLVVWPWNLAMVALVWVLFSTAKFFSPAPVALAAGPLKKSKAAAPKNPAAPDMSLTRTFSDLLRCKSALVILALYTLLPALSFGGRWDSYFSFTLYAKSEAVANVFVSKNFGDCLPPRLRHYFGPFGTEHDPQRQNAYTFGFATWGYEELRVPPISEVRNFRRMFEHLRIYAETPQDLRMLVRTRGGPVIFWEGDREEFLQPAAKANQSR